MLLRLFVRAAVLVRDRCTLGNLCHAVMSTRLERKLLRIDVLAAIQAATFARDSNLPLSLHLVPTPVPILVFLANAV